jgi:predicted transcriptional regulator
MNRLEKRYALWQARKLTSIPNELAIRLRLSLLNSNCVWESGNYAYADYGTFLSSFY